MKIYRNLSIESNEQRRQFCRVAKAARRIVREMAPASQKAAKLCDASLNTAMQRHPAFERVAVKAVSLIKF